MKDIKLVGCSKYRVLIYLLMSVVKLKTVPILVIADTSVIKSNYYMVGYYCYVYNNKNYVIIALLLVATGDPLVI